MPPPHEPSTVLAADDAAWSEIEALVDELAELARHDLAAGDFLPELLDRAVRAMAAEGGAIWLSTPGGTSSDGTPGGTSSHGTPGGVTEPACRINLPAEVLGGSADQHRALLDEAFRAGGLTVVPPGAAISSSAGNPTPLLLLLAPITGESAAVGLLEIFQRPGISPAVQESCRRLMEAMCELAADFYRHQELRELREQAGHFSRIEQFAEKCHASLDIDEVAYGIANEGRALIGCDRLSVLVSRGGSWQVKAISGIDKPDRRANEVRLLEQLVTRAAATGETWWLPAGGNGELPPPIELALDAYIDVAHPRSIGLLPLEHRLPAAESAAASPPARPRPHAALVVEQFESGRDGDAVRKMAEIVRRHAAAALSNALMVSVLPVLPLLKAAGRVRLLTRRPYSTIAIAIAGALMMVTLALLVIPWPLEIEGRGELQPERRQIVFAPDDGFVESVAVRHGKEVRKDTLLATMSNSDLEYRFREVQGNLNTAQKRRASVLSRRRSLSPTGPEARREIDELSGQEKELDAMIAGYEAQLAALRQQRARLRVESPLDGEVLTWNVTETLDKRSVRRGQALFTVADRGGPWILELRIPDRHASHVTSAWRSSRRENYDLEVSFKLMSDPAATYYGTVEEIGAATEIDESGEAYLPVRVAFDREGMENLRPGTTVVGQVDCGWAPLGYVWLHDVIDAVRTWILF